MASPALRCRRGLALPRVEQWPSTSSATKEAPPLKLSEHSPPAQLFWQRSGLHKGSTASGSRLKADHTPGELVQIDTLFVNVAPFNGEAGRAEQEKVAPGLCHVGGAVARGGQQRHRSR